MLGTRERMGECMVFPSPMRVEGTVKILTSHVRNAGNYRWMNGVGKGNSCMGKRGLLLSLLFAQKSKGRDLKIQKLLTCTDSIQMETETVH